MGEDATHKANFVQYFGSPFSWRRIPAQIQRAGTEAKPRAYSDVARQEEVHQET
jgi:hypothetical protein